MPSPRPRLISAHKKLYLHLWIECSPLSPISLCVKLQTPHHLRVRVFAQVCEDFGERGASLGAPGVYAAFGGCYGCEGGGGPEGVEEREGDGHGGSREASCGVEDVGRYRVALGSCCCAGHGGGIDTRWGLWRGNAAVDGVLEERQ